MSAREVHLAVMIPELDEMRTEVAAAAHEEPDMVSHRAYLMQARSLRMMYGWIASTWFNAAQEVKAERGEVEEEVVELRYAERLAQWLRSHVRNTLEMMEGGEKDLAQQRSNFSEGELAITRLYAIRHHETVADFCERSATALDERAAALRSSNFQP